MKIEDLKPRQYAILCQAAQILKVSVKEVREMDKWIPISPYFRRKDEDKGIFFVRSKNTIERYLSGEPDINLQLGKVYYSLKRATKVAEQQTTNISNIKANNPFYVFRAVRLVEPVTTSIETTTTEL